MEPDASYISETALAIRKQFDISREIDTGIAEGKIKYEELKKILAEKIKSLIDHEFENFLNILYRIDVDENKVKKIFADAPFDEAVEKVAELIIQRQMDKIITRKKFSRPGGELKFDI